MKFPVSILTFAFLALLTFEPSIHAATASSAPAFPPPLSSYEPAPGGSLWAELKSRAAAEPFNVAATLFFLLAILHTFLAPMFLKLAHRFERQHRELKRGSTEASAHGDVSFKAELFHFLGEVEAVFGVWVLPLLLSITLAKGWTTARDYIGHLGFTEPIFVVVIMLIAASRPVLKFAEKVMAVVASLGRGSAAAWWLSILTMGPLLGSFITEPAAMTISALLLREKFFDLKPRPVFAYATLGLLFVNVSVGGTLTHFAAPPVLMVAKTWGWGMSHMLVQFGWKAAIGIGIANLLYLAWFKRDFREMAQRPMPREGSASNDRPIPLWITVAHLLFLGWTVANNHYPALFVGGFLFYLAFAQATAQHQSDMRLRPAMLVGFFLAGLVVHGSLQGWWIEPVLTRLSETPLLLIAMVLTAFNDNAAITFLASQVPGFSDALKYAVVAGAVAGGGLTVIANAPNPAGQALLSRYFPNGVSPLKLFLGAAVPTLIMALMFLLFR